jgi:hypothetical protein
MSIIVGLDSNSSLTQTNKNRCLPLHLAPMHSIQGFRMVLEYGIRYCPSKKRICLLFKKDNDDDTPFQMACGRCGRDKVMNVIKDTLLDCQRRSEDYNNNTGPYNVMDALITAAIDENVHLDCIYFLMRRQPDVLVKLLSQLSETSAAVSASNDWKYHHQRH